MISARDGRVESLLGTLQVVPHFQKSHQIFSINLTQTFQAIGPFVDKIVKQSTVRFVEIASNMHDGRQFSDGYESTPSEFDSSMLPPGVSTSGNNVKLGNLALANIVSALGDPRRNVTYEVRQELYQYSIITRILQDALGGSSLTVAICSLSASESQVEESKNTLTFAKQLSKFRWLPVLHMLLMHHLALLYPKKYQPHPLYLFLVFYLVYSQ